MKTVLVTGAAGFVGSHLSERCLREGWRVVGVDNLSVGTKQNLSACLQHRKFTLIKCDLTGKEVVENIRRSIRRSKISEITDVIHLAAEKIPRYGGRLRTLSINLLGTFAALELARTFRSRFLFASTSDVYGLTENLPFRENENLVFGPSSIARWSYGASKYLGEHLAFSFQEEHHVAFVILRIFGVYGPRMVRGWKGNAMSAFFERAIQNGSYELHGDGKQQRSFLYIDDLIDAMTICLKDVHFDGSVINVGTTEVISMRQLAQKIHRLVNSGTRFHTSFVSYQSFTGHQYQDVQKKLPDLTNAKNILGWTPQTSLADGLRRTAEWYKKQRS